MGENEVDRLHDFCLRLAERILLCHEILANLAEKKVRNPMQNELTALKVKLTRAIQEFIDREAESDEWERLSVYVGDDLAYHMANAAISVLAGVADVQKYLRQENLLGE